MLCSRSIPYLRKSKIKLFVERRRQEFSLNTLDRLPGVNIIKLFIAVIYCHSMTILLFCVQKLNYLGNNHGMAVNYHSKKLCNIGPYWQNYVPW